MIILKGVIIKEGLGEDIKCYINGSKGKIIYWKFN